MSQMHVQQMIADELFAIAVQAADQQGRKFRPIAAAAIRGLADAAAIEVVKPGRLGVRSSERAARDMTQREAEAKVAIRALIMAMAEEADGIAGYAPDALGERTLAGAMARFCPCWPFC